MFEDFVASAKWLKARPECTGKLGAIGFCFGGGIVNQLAVRLGDDLDRRRAVLRRASRAPRTPRRSRRRSCCTTRIRPRTPASASASPPSRQALKANNKTYQLFIYEGAQHGFHNDTTPRYDEKAAKLAWQRTLEFFNKNLRG